MVASPVHLSAFFWLTPRSPTRIRLLVAFRPAKSRNRKPKLASLMVVSKLDKFLSGSNRWMWFHVPNDSQFPKQCQLTLRLTIVVLRFYYWSYLDYVFASWMTMSNVFVTLNHKLFISILLRVSLRYTIISYIIPNIKLFHQIHQHFCFYY